MPTEHGLLGKKTSKTVRELRVSAPQQHPEVISVSGRSIGLLHSSLLFGAAIMRMWLSW